MPKGYWKDGRPITPPVNVKHGEGGNIPGVTRTKEYALWGSMIQRCCNPKHKKFHNYGGRGISVCQAWRESYPAFLAYMGRRPSPHHSLDRIDNEGDYEPRNVCWATNTEQCNNMRKNFFIEYEGISLTPSGWSRIVGLPRGLIRCRILRGWAIKDALTQEPTKLTKRNRDHATV